MKKHIFGEVVNLGALGLSGCCFKSQVATAIRLGCEGFHNQPCGICYDSSSLPQTIGCRKTACIDKELSAQNNFIS